MAGCTPPSCHQRLRHSNQNEGGRTRLTACPSAPTFLPRGHPGTEARPGWVESGRREPRGRMAPVSPQRGQEGTEPTRWRRARAGAGRATPPRMLCGTPLPVVGSPGVCGCGRKRAGATLSERRLHFRGLELALVLPCRRRGREKFAGQCWEDHLLPM